MTSGRDERRALRLAGEGFAGAVLEREGKPAWVRGIIAEGGR